MFKVGSDKSFVSYKVFSFIFFAVEKVTSHHEAVLDPSGMSEQEKYKQYMSAYKHVCKYCGKRFQRKLFLERHERIHTGERPFQCKHCNFTSAQKGNLNQHMYVKHKAWL